MGKKTFSSGVELSGKTLGIIGFGRIGQRLCAMAKGIGMDVIASDIYHVPGIEAQLGMRYAETDELLAKADFISLHTPAVNGQALICAENIAKMKDGVVIVNTSRGNNVDEAALLTRLNPARSRAVDSLPTTGDKQSALYASARFRTPHIGAGTTRRRPHRAELVILSQLKTSVFWKFILKKIILRTFTLFFFGIGVDFFSSCL